MKKIILFIIISIYFFGFSNAYAKNSENIKTCKFYESLAEIIMDARQKGAPMSGLYEKDYGSKEKNDITRGLIKEAYEIPRFNSEKSKKNAVLDFKNEKFGICIKNLK